MAVASQGLRDAFVAHDEEREAVGQGPFLIAALLEEIYALLEKARVGGDDFHAGMARDGSVEGDEITPVLRVAVSIAELGKHPFGRDELELWITRSRRSLRMAFFPRIKEGEKVKRVGKCFPHFFGSPRM